jgi:hypothetical protein
MLDLLQRRKAAMPLASAFSVLIESERGDDRRTGQPGQGTLQISPENVSPGIMSVIIARSRKTGEGLNSTILVIGCRSSRLEQVPGSTPR